LRQREPPTPSPTRVALPCPAAAVAPPIPPSLPSVPRLLVRVPLRSLSLSLSLSRTHAHKCTRAYAMQREEGALLFLFTIFVFFLAM
jgi:hypothetical protein